jgi:hypothetical protein
MPPVGIPLSDRVSGRAPGSFRSRNGDGGGLQYVLWKRDPSLRFFPSRRNYRRKGSIRGWAIWPHHGVARPPVVSLAPGPFRLIFGLREASVKIGGSAFVLSNSENISCVTFLKYKNSKKTGNWHCGILLIG